MGQHSKNPDASNPNQDKSYYPDGSTTLSMANNGYEKEQITRATIGSGIINITNNNNQTQDITSLNRNINKNQEITKDTITGALNIQTTIDNRIIGAIIGNEGAQDSLVKTITNAPGNTFETAKQLSDLTGMIPGSPVWVSRYIDANNIEIKNGEPINHPAPNLLTGFWDKPWENPSVGRADAECKNSTLCKNFASDEAYHLQALHYLVPGFKSFSQYHDSAMINKETGEEFGADYKFISIFSYLPANYYGAIGTMIDFRNMDNGQSNNSTSQNKY